MPTATGDLRISYRAQAGQHEVTTTSGARYELEVLGKDAPAVEHRYPT